MEQERINFLLGQYAGNSLSSAEKAEWNELVQSDETKDLLQQALLSQLTKTGRDATVMDTRLHAVYDRVFATGKEEHRIHFIKTAWFRYAAILLLIAGTATYLYVTNPSFRRNPVATATHEAPIPQDIPPGGNRAILTLADGSSILLDSAANGSLANEAGTQITKQGTGMLVYHAPQDPGGMTKEGKPGYNTISTPNGGQYQITLPDGTKVWLNAASSVRFPTAFIKDRKVTVTGEVYFEIARDPVKPFFVSARDAEIAVLGTSFNINAYTDEPAVATTLLEGSVRINSGDRALTLKPGQQAIVNTSSSAGVQLVPDADISQVMAWQRGAFSFSNTDLAVVMRQLSRWYDVEIVYENKIAGKRISGSMGRDLNLQEVIEVLKGLGVNARMENGRLMIDKKY